MTPGGCQPWHPGGVTGDTQLKRQQILERTNDDGNPVESSSSSQAQEERKKTADDLALLVAKADRRFGAGRQRVAAAIATFGRPWVEAAVALPNLKKWGGVLKTLENWRAEGGPPAKASRRDEPIKIYRKIIRKGDPI